MGLCCQNAAWKWREGPIWFWVKVVLLLMCLGLLAGAFINWVAPFLMNKEVVPFIHWETTALSEPVLAIVIFSSVSLFPIFLLPSTPSMWTAGMIFGYGYGFLICFPAVAVGVSLPYLIGSLFNHKIQDWLDKDPKRASVLRSAGEGDWSHQFKAVMLIRISPFPYILYNYCSVATNVSYGPYLLGSLLGMVPDIFVAIYTGILIRTIAEASNKKRTLTKVQIALNVIGFCMTLIATAVCTMYAKRRLKELELQADEEVQKEDHPLL